MPLLLREARGLLLLLPLPLRDAARLGEAEDEGACDSVPVAGALA